jgi:glycosyltransferase involved in cell wall biosynthesis
MRLSGPFKGGEDTSDHAAGPGTSVVAAISGSPSPRRAMELMRNRRWAEAARMWRRLINEASPPELWMQFGHALKEAGHLRAAGDAYRKALKNESLDSLIQMAHYQKAVGHFEEAENFYRAALERSQTREERDDVRKFIGPLARIRDANPRLSNCNLFFSCVMKTFGEEASKEGYELGRTHYSYAFAARGFCRAADELEIEYKTIVSPQYISNAGQLTTAQRPIHLGFYPASEARLLKGAFNILCFAWEFPRLQTPAEITDPHAFADYRHMLNAFDEIWVPSRYTAEVLAKEISKPVFFVPSPIIRPATQKRPAKRKISSDTHEILARLSRVEWVPLSIFRRLQGNFNNHAMARRRGTLGIFDGVDVERPSKVYLTVFNPYDFRKQIKPLLEGFLRFLVNEPQAMLLLKTACLGETNANINQRILDQIADETELMLPNVSDRIWITNFALSDDEMSDLDQLASFYICTSYAESQNLPLLEAMSYGVVPVSVAHTAMADYVSDENSVIIQSTLRSAPNVIKRIYGMYDIDVYTVEAEDVLAALLRSTKLTAQDYEKKSRAAAATVAEAYNPYVFERALAEARVRMNERGARV